MIWGLGETWYVSNSFGICRKIARVKSVTWFVKGEIVAKTLWILQGKKIIL